MGIGCFSPCFLCLTGWKRYSALVEASGHDHKNPEKSFAGIGLIADTHGSISALSRAIQTLSVKKVTELIHLGDFFDSVYNKNIDEVLSVLQKYNVRAVKGNNDYQVEKMIENGFFDKSPDRNGSCLAFLKKTPILYKIGNTCFSHSMPYDSMRSFYEPIDTGTTEKALEIFQNTSYHTFFCGHSHNPVCFRYNSGKVMREAIHPGRPIHLSGDERYIFIVGSAESGECGFYDMSESSYERITFD
jgi:predicted phosphodiesterase